MRSRHKLNVWIHNISIHQEGLSLVFVKPLQNTLVAKIPLLSRALIISQCKRLRRGLLPLTLTQSPDFCHCTVWHLPIGSMIASVAFHPSWTRFLWFSKPTPNLPFPNIPFLLPRLSFYRRPWFFPPAVLPAHPPLLCHSQYTSNTRLPYVHKSPKTLMFHQSITSFGPSHPRSF